VFSHFVKFLKLSKAGITAGCSVLNSVKGWRSFATNVCQLCFKYVLLGLMRRNFWCDNLLNFGTDNSLVMRTLNIAISDLEYKKFGLKTDQLSFTDFVDMSSRELSRQNLKKAVELSDRYGLSTMSMDEISAEVKAVRNNAAHS
jgi:hypothetical protein